MNIGYIVSLVLPNHQDEKFYHANVFYTAAAAYRFIRKYRFSAPWADLKVEEAHRESELGKNFVVISKTRFQVGKEEDRPDEDVVLLDLGQKILVNGQTIMFVDMEQALKKALSDVKNE
jgi:hypothetical protein